MPHAVVNGTRIYYEVEGASNAPWITFSNAICTDHAMWAPQARAFGRDFRILRYDTRGHGNSDGSEGFYSFELLARDVVGLWDQLGIAKSHFVGLSLGGMTGLQLGIAHAARVEKLVVCCCRADAPPEWADQWKKRREQVMASGMETLVDDTLKRWLSPTYRAENPDVVARISRSVAQTSLRGYVGCTGALAGLNLRARIKDIRNPTLFLVGSLDGANPELMRAMHMDLPGSQFAVIEGAAHLSNLDQEHAFNTAVRRFL